MKEYDIIAHTSVFIWAIMPYFYRRHKHFFFFLFLAMNDVIGVLLWNVFSISGQTSWLVFNYLMLVSINRDYFIKNLRIFLIGIIPISVIVMFLGPSQIVFLCFLVHLAIFFFFIKYLLSDYLLSGIVNKHYIILSFYLLISIFKLLAFMREITVGIEAFFVGTFVQIFIGIILIYLQLRNDESEKLVK